MNDILLISAVLIVFLFFYFDRKSGEEFIKWIFNNYNEIKEGSAHYKGVPITFETTLKGYQAAFSFIFISKKVRSRYFINDYHLSFFANILYSLMTIIYGWWAFPWGPIYTVQVLFLNIKGGEKITVKQLINRINSEKTYNLCKI